MKKLKDFKAYEVKETSKIKGGHATRPKTTETQPSQKDRTPGTLTVHVCHL